jgi:hypothetical protein
MGMALQAPILILLLFLSYVYFWFHSFHEAGVARVFKKGSWESEKELVPNTSVKPLSLASVFWATVLVFLVLQAPGTCTLNPVTWRSMDALLSALTICVGWKVFLAPASTSFKSYQREPDGRLTENWRLAVFDFITAYPVTLFETLVYKLTLVAFFSFLVWLFGWRSQSSAIPDGLFYAWAIFEIGRGIRLCRSPSVLGIAQLVAFAVYLLSMFAVWMLVEKVLSGCGAKAGVMPTWDTLAVSLAALPIIEFFVAVFAAVL